jgi:acetyl-CoA carboxylase biotin carboxylase subunit
MIGKLIVWGENRDACIRRLRRALEEFIVEGPRTNIPLHQRIARDPAFETGDYTIKWLERWLEEQRGA